MNDIYSADMTHSRRQSAHAQPDPPHAIVGLKGAMDGLSWCQRFACRSIIGLGFALGLTQAFAQPTSEPNEQTFGSWTFIHVPGSDVWTSGTESEKYEDIIIGISYVAELGCNEAVFEYSMPAPSAEHRLDDGDYPGVIEIQIDDKDKWVVEQGSAYVETGPSIDATALIYSVSFTVDDDFTKELVESETVWVNFVDEDDTDWFDLEGAKLAIGLAKLSCHQYLLHGGTAPTPRNMPNPDLELERPTASET